MEGLLWRDVCELEVAKTIPNIEDIVDEEDEDGDKALVRCLTQKRFDTFCYFVDCGANIYIKDVLGDALLHSAVEKQSIKCVEKLLSVGAWVDCRNEYNWTPLHVSMVWCDEGTIPLLLIKHKANINALTNDNMTPLDYALDFYRGGGHDDPKMSPHIKTMILMGAKLNDFGIDDAPLLFRELFEKTWSMQKREYSYQESIEETK